MLIVLEVQPKLAVAPAWRRKRFAVEDALSCADQRRG